MLDVFELEELLRSGAAAQRLRLERALRPSNLSPAQFEALRQLKIRGNMSGVELARACLLSPQTVGVVVENLEKKALVRRAADSTNLRIQRICATDSGSLLLESASVCVAEAIGPPLMDATRGEDVAAVMRFLSKLVGNER